MKTSEKIVAGELLLISGLGLMALGKGYLLLCDRVTALEKQQVKFTDNLTQIARQHYSVLKEK